MIEEFDLSAVARLYAESLGAHGATPQGVGWKHVASQNLRFAKLLEVARNHSDPFSLNDLGCGYGALYTFLVEQRIAVSAYCGVDISEAMLSEARRRTAMPKVVFELGQQLSRKMDFSFASGIFNVRLAAATTEWERYIDSTIGDLAAHSTHGFAFNLLTTYVDYREDHLYYGDPGYFLDLCKRRYGNVRLLHDYPLFEWTMLVRLT